MLGIEKDLKTLPEDADFGHSCEHGAGPHRIKVLIFKSHNKQWTYQRLRQAAETTGR